MSWNTVQEALGAVNPPCPYRFEMMSRDETADVIASILGWYPEISVGVASCFVQPEFYERKVAFAGEAGKSFIVVLIKRGHEIVGLLACESEHEAQTLYGRLAIVAPEHRGAGLGQYSIELIEAIGQALSMGLIYGMATLKIPHVQQAFERLGWQLIGIAPGYDRELVSPGVVKRVYEAVYAKVLVGASDLLLPRWGDMTPRTRELFELLFAERMQPVRAGGAAAGFDTFTLPPSPRRNAWEMKHE
jgi:GNAT superfamily N-acetyltransferase